MLGLIQSNLLNCRIPLSSIHGRSNVHGDRGGRDGDGDHGDGDRGDGQRRLHAVQAKQRDAAKRSEPR